MDDVTPGDAAVAVTESERLVDADRATLVHPYLAGDTSERVVMVRGAGSTLWDAAGREYLDATGGLWLAQVGHGRRELGDVAARQMEELEYFASFWEFSNDKAIALASRLAELAPDSLDHVYFTSGGSEGNEAALRMARYYHHRRGDHDRTWIIARRHAYHGIGYGSGTATGSDLYDEGFGPVLPHVTHVTPPWPFHTELFDGQDPTDYCLNELERTINELGPGNVAAFIGEPIMGVAGMIVPPEDYWPRVRELLTHYGILLILDEVVTAYGRIGSWFAAEHYGIVPDLLVTAKGISSGYMPLGAVLVAGDVADALALDHGFPIGYTYNGHPTACAVGLANIDIIEREDLLGRARTTGALLFERLQGLASLPVVGEVRGLGMMLAVELVAEPGSTQPLPVADDPLPDVIRREHGVIVRDCANDVGHSLVLSPPLVLTDAEADRVVAAIANVLDR
jgi:PLP-dependent transaminase